MNFEKDNNSWRLSNLVEKIKEIELSFLQKDTEALELWYEIRFKIYLYLTIELGIYGVAHRKEKNKKIKLLVNMLIKFKKS